METTIVFWDTYWGCIGILEKEMENRYRVIGYTLGLCRDQGQENENRYSIIGFILGFPCTSSKLSNSMTVRTAGCCITYPGEEILYSMPSEL